MNVRVLAFVTGFVSCVCLSLAQPRLGPIEPNAGYGDRSAPSTYQWDNGTGAFSAWFVNSGEVIGVLAFDAMGGADSLTSISCAWRSLANGATARVFVWQDNGTGVNNATLLHEQTVIVQNSGNTGVYNLYPLLSTVPVKGRFYIGFAALSTTTGTLPVRSTPTPPYVNGRAFVGGTTTPPIDAANLAAMQYVLEDVSAIGVPGYFILRADGLGTSFTYQGRVTKGGTDYTGPADLRFTFYDRNIGGGSVAPTFEQTGVGVSNGLFTVLIPTDAAWFVDAPDRYLEVQVRTPGDSDFVTLSTRQRVTPAPTATVARVAEYAKNAQLAQSAAVAQSMTWTGLLNVPAVLPPWVSATSGISYSGGSVGIGVASPGAALHVKGGPKYFNSYFESADNEGTWLSLTNTDGPGRWWSLIVTGTGNAEPQGSLLFRDNNLLGVRMMITPAGNVGVGTTTPEQRLSVNGGIQVLTGTTSLPNYLAFGAVGTSIGLAENSDRIAFQRVNVLQSASQNVSELRLMLGDDAVPNANVFDSFVIGAAPGGAWTSLFQFRTDGAAFKLGGGSWAAFCDPRLKHDITPMHGTLDRLLSLRGYEFLYNDDAIAARRGLPGTQIGLMADDVERVVPDWISRDIDGMRMVTERGTTALMVEALRDLRTEKDTQLQVRDAKIDRLEKDNADLKARLERLERAIGALK